MARRLPNTDWKRISQKTLARIEAEMQGREAGMRGDAYCNPKKYGSPAWFAWNYGYRQGRFWFRENGRRPC